MTKYHWQFIWGLSFRFRSAIYNTTKVYWNCPNPIKLPCKDFTTEPSQFKAGKPSEFCIQYQQHHMSVLVLNKARYIQKKKKRQPSSRNQLISFNHPHPNIPRTFNISLKWSVCTSIKLTSLIQNNWGFYATLWLCQSYMTLSSTG